MNLSKKLTAIAAIVCGIAAGAWMLRPPPDSAAETPAAAPELVSPGLVQPSEDAVALAFESAGRIAELAVDEGGRVEAGQVIARLDDRLPRARVAKAEAALLAAKARLELAVRGPRPAEIEAMEGEVAAAEANTRDRDRKLEQAERLMASKVIPQSELDTAREAAAHARSVQASTRARLALVREGTRSELKREAEAAVAAAAAELEEARALLAQTELRSPRSGVVLRRLAEVGEQVSAVPPKVVFTVANVEHLEILIEVDEADVGRVHEGQAGFAVADAFGDRRFPGKIVRVQHELGRKQLRTDSPRARVDTRVLEVSFALDRPETLPLGLRMEVHLAAAQAQ